MGNDTLPIPASVFYAKQPFSYYTSDPLFVPDAIFDSGTPFSILPEAAYAALSAKVFTSNVTLTSPETAFNVTGPPSAFERSGTYEPVSVSCAPDAKTAGVLHLDL